MVKVLVVGASESLELFQKKTGKLDKKHGPFDVILVAEDSNINSSLFGEKEFGIATVNDISIAYYSKPSDLFLAFLDERAAGVDILVALNSGIDDSPELDKIIRAARPRYIFSTNDAPFFERPPFQVSLASHATRFISLGKLGGDTRWHYAFNISKITESDATSLPPKTTAYPFVAAVASTPKKRKLDESSFFWTENQPTSPTRGKRSAPPPSYICNKCRQPGHFIRQCPSRGKAPRTAACWFCLSNPDIEQHLIIALGQHVYIALSKGALTDAGHFILVPVSHVDRIRGMTRDGVAEVETAQRVVRTVLHQRGLGLVCFQMYSAGDEHHFIVQMVAVPSADVTVDKDGGCRIRDFFVERARDAGLEVWESGFESLPDGDPYFVLNYSENKADDLVLVPGSQGSRANQRFGAIGLAEFLGTPDRSNWKKYVLTKSQEDADVEAWRKLITLD